MTVLAIDIGGSGSRLLAADGDDRRVSRRPHVVADGRADHAEVVAELAAALGPVQGPVAAVAVGAAGLLAHGDVPAVAAAITSAWPGAVAVIASDAVTAAAAAWGDEGGAVVAAGTGVVGLGTDFAETWLRSDGWGHLLDDAGGAAWIGTRGLRAALRALDDRPGGSAALLAAVEAQIGDARRLPDVVRSAANPATALAAFAPAVTTAARSGDGAARAIVQAAARELADTGLSVVRDGIPPRLALVGGLAAEPEIAEGFAERVRERRPDIALAVGSATPLDGALALARRAAYGDPLPSHPPFLTVTPSLS